MIGLRFTFVDISYIFIQNMDGIFGRWCIACILCQSKWWIIIRNTSACSYIYFEIWSLAMFISRTKHSDWRWQSRVMLQFGLFVLPKFGLYFYFPYKLCCDKRAFCISCVYWNKIRDMHMLVLSSLSSIFHTDTNWNVRNDVRRTLKMPNYHQRETKKDRTQRNGPVMSNNYLLLLLIIKHCSITN